MGNLKKLSTRRELSNFVFGYANRVLHYNLQFSNKFTKRVNEVEADFIRADSNAESKGKAPYHNDHPLFYVEAATEILNYVHEYHNPGVKKITIVEKDYASLIPFAEKNLDAVRQIHNADRKKIAVYAKFLAKYDVALEDILYNSSSRTAFEKGINQFKVKVESDLKNIVMDPHRTFKIGNYLKTLKI